MNRQDISDEIREARYEQETEELWEQLLLIIVCGALILGAVFYGAHWLDQQFNWHLEQWLKSHVHL